MDTVKSDATELNQQQSESNPKLPKFQNIKTAIEKVSFKKWLKYGGFSIVLCLLIIAFIRVPYVGVFIDSVFFSFLFGYAKYVLYIYLVVLIVQILIDKKIKILFSKRFILAILLTTIFLAILFSGIQLLNVLSSGVNTKIINEYLTYWYKVMFQSNPIFVFGKPGYLDGGIIGSCVGATSGFFLIIFALLAIIAIFLFLFKSWRNLLIQKTMIIKNRIKQKKPKEIILDGESVIQEQLDFIEGKKDITTHKIEIKHNSANYLELLHSKTKKQYNSDNLENQQTSINLHELALMVQDLLKDHHINVEEGSVKPALDTLEIAILLTPENLNKFRMVSDKLKQSLKKYEYVIAYYETNVVLRFKTENNILSERTNIIINSKIPESLKYVFSLTNEMKPIYLNLRDNSLIGIYSTTKQNTDNLLTAMLCSISWNYNAKYIQTFYISPTNDKNLFLRLSIFHKIKQINKNSEIIDFLANLEKYCTSMINKFKDNKIKDIYHYNNITSNPKPNRIIIINDIDIIGQSLNESLSYIKRIIPMCEQCGISIIMVDHSYDFISEIWFNYKTIASFKATIGISNKLIKDDLIFNLDTYNHGCLIYENKPVTTFIASMFNEEELNKIIDAIEKTYKKYEM